MTAWTCLCLECWGLLGAPDIDNHAGTMTVTAQTCQACGRSIDADDAVKCKPLQAEPDGTNLPRNREHDA